MRGPLYASRDYGEWAVQVHRKHPAFEESVWSRVHHYDEGF